MGADTIDVMGQYGVDEAKIEQMRAERRIRVENW